MTANKATPEELVKRLRNGIAPGTCDLCQADSTVSIRCDRGDCEWEFNLKLAAADLIESQRNAVIEELVKRQAEDDGLWFNAKYVTEAYLQDALRQLHKAVEDLKDDSAVPVERQCES